MIKTVGVWRGDLGIIAHPLRHCFEGIEWKFYRSLSATKADPSLCRKVVDVHAERPRGKTDDRGDEAVAEPTRQFTPKPTQIAFEINSR